MDGPLWALNRVPNGNFRKGTKSCTHSASARAGNWLSAKISHVREITRVRVLNRGDCCKGRINGSNVFAGWKLCGTFKYYHLNSWATFYCPKNTYADRVTIV